MSPDAPGRFSTITGSPTCSCIASATTRAIVSIPPPAPKGTTVVIGFDGKSAAIEAVAALNTNAPKALVQAAVPRTFMVLPYEKRFCEYRATQGFGMFGYRASGTTQQAC